MLFGETRDDIPATEGLRYHSVRTAVTSPPEVRRLGSFRNSANVLFNPVGSFRNFGSASQCHHFLPGNGGPRWALYGQFSARTRRSEAAIKGARMVGVARITESVAARYGALPATTPMLATVSPFFIEGTAQTYRTTPLDGARASHTVLPNRSVT